MRSRYVSLLVTFAFITGCSQSRSSLPPVLTQAQQSRSAHPQSSALQPYGRDVMLTLFTGGGIFVIAYGPYALNGSPPVWGVTEITFGLSNAARDPTSNLVFFENGQEAIDSFAPLGSSVRREIETGDDDAIQVAVDHHGAVYGLMDQFAKTPSIIGFAKDANVSGPAPPPTTTLAGPKTGLTSSPFAYSMAFDEINELFVLGDSKIRVFGSPQNGDVPPIRELDSPLLQAASFAVDQRGDVAIVPKTRTSVALFRALAHGAVVPIKTLVGPSTGIHDAHGVLYCNNDTLWVLDHISDGHERLLLYPAGWNGNTKPARMITMPSLGGEFEFVADMSIY